MNASSTSRTLIWSDLGSHLSQVHKPNSCKELGRRYSYFSYFLLAAQPRFHQSNKVPKPTDNLQAALGAHNLYVAEHKVNASHAVRLTPVITMPCITGHYIDATTHFKIKQIFWLIYYPDLYRVISVKSANQLLKQVFA